MQCPKCDSKKSIKNGQALEKQRYKCKDCGCNFTQSHKRGAALEIKLQALRLYLKGAGLRLIEARKKSSDFQWVVGAKKPSKLS